MACLKGKALKSFGPSKRVPETGFIFQEFCGKRCPPFIDLDVTRELMGTWETTAGDLLTNSVGLLALHLSGNLHHFIGAHLGGIPHTQNFEGEFAGIPLEATVLPDEIAAPAPPSPPPSRRFRPANCSPRCRPHCRTAPVGPSATS